MRLWALCAAALLQGCGGDAADGPPAASGPRGALLITIGGLRRDALGAYGAAPSPTPALDALAAKGVLFEDALAPSPLDLPSHASLMTGLDPRRHGARDDGAGALGAEAVGLATLLARHDLRARAVVSSTELAAGSGLERGFERFDAPAYPRARVRALPGERNAEEAVTLALADVAALAAGGQRFLYWLQLDDPHLPFDAPGSDPAASAEARYAGEVRFADGEVARLFAGLEEQGLLDELAVVVTSDHGMHLDGGGPRGHGEDLALEVLRVPLILSAPGLAPARVGGAVSLVDVAPTVLALLGVAVPDGLDGESLLPCIARGRAREGRALAVESWHPLAAHGLFPLTGIARDDLLLLSDPEWHLFDRAADPRLERDLYRPRDARSESMRAEHALRFGEAAPGGRAVAPDVRAARLARLAEADQDLAAGRPGPALELLRQLAREAPDDAAVLGGLSGLLLDGSTPSAADLQEAEPLLARALELRPDDPALAFLSARRCDARAQRLERALGTGHGSPADEAALAELLGRRRTEARRALDREPTNAALLLQVALWLAEEGPEAAAELAGLLPRLAPADAEAVSALATERDAGGR